MLRALTPIVEYRKTDAFAPGPNLTRAYPVLRRRPLFAWTLWMELRHHGKRSWGKQSCHAPQNTDGILGMVQDHRNQR